MAYPVAITSFTTKSTGDTIAASHVNSVQTDVVAVETYVGTNASQTAPQANTVMKSSSAGVSTWAKADLAADVTGTLPVANGGTGVTASTGTVAVVLSTSPVLVTPTLGVASATSINKVALTAPATSATLTIADGKTLTVSDNTTLNGPASATVAGPVELATSTEINTGTDTTRAMPVDQFVASNRNVRYFLIRVLGSTTDTSVASTVGGDIELPFTGTITEIGAYVDTAGTTGTMTVDVNLNGATIMTTNKITLDSTEKSSRTAATAPALTTTAVTAGDLITIDIDGVHTTAAKGLTVRLGIRMT